MYRVARKAVIAFEARDSMLTQLVVQFGHTGQFEVSSIDPEGRGGVADTGIPNFVYRWTEREVIKTIASYGPGGTPTFQFFYGLRPSVRPGPKAI